MAATKKAPEAAWISTKDIAELVRRSAPSTDPTRPHINSLRFEGAHVVSTDGHRLHRLPSPLPGLTCTIPTWAIRAAVDSLAAYENGRISLAPDGTHVELRTTSGTIRAEQPTLPPWNQVHPETSGRAGVPAIEMTLEIPRAIREIRRLKKAGAGCVSVEGLLYAPAEPPSRHVARFGARTVTGHHLEDQPPDWDVDAPEWNGRAGFSPDYLIEALQAAKWSLLRVNTGPIAKMEVTLKIWDQLDPAVMSWQNGDAVIMPMRV